MESETIVIPPEAIEVESLDEYKKNQNINQIYRDILKIFQKLLILY